MDESRATRADLLARKSQAALAQQGAKLLESKREALLKELMGLIRPLVDAYAAIPEVAQHAGRSLVSLRVLPSNVPGLRARSTSITFFAVGSRVASVRGSQIAYRPPRSRQISTRRSKIPLCDFGAC